MTTPIGTTARERLLDGLPVEERRYDLAGVRTAVLEGGDGPPIVLLHGPAGHGGHWLRVLPELVKYHAVVAPDLPGHGETQGAEADVVLAWLEALIERTCPEPPALVGYALGGAIAARFAADHGDRLRRLVLVDTFGLVPFDPVPQFGQAVHEFLADPTDATHDGLWRYCAHDADRLRAAFGERWEPFRDYNVEHASGALLEQFALPAIEPETLARIAVPTALIWGRHDLATPLTAADEAAIRHGWRLHIVEDCADDPPVEQPAAFLRALAEEAR